jgi:hypothetical protein
LAAGTFDASFEAGRTFDERSLRLGFDGIRLTRLALGWEYVDLAGVVQGPFDDETMKHWLRGGAFNAVGEDLCLRRTRPAASEQGCGCCRAFSKLGQVRNALCPLSNADGCAAEALLGPDAMKLVDDYESESSDDSDDDENDADEADEFAIVGYIDGLADVVDYSTEDWRVAAKRSGRVDRIRRERRRRVLPDRGRTGTLKSCRGNDQVFTGARGRSLWR